MTQQDDAPDRQQIDNLAYFKEKAHEIQTELATLVADAELSDLLAQLQGHPAWKPLQERIERITVGETQRLRRNRLDQYQLGRVQGMLAALEILGRSKPLSQEEIDARRERATVLHNQLTHYRNLLD